MPSSPEALPHGVELRVVDVEEGAAPVAEVEAEPLELFEARSPEARALFDLGHRALGEVGLVPGVVVEVHVLEEAAREVGVGERLDLLQLRRSPSLACRRAPAQVHGDSDAGGVHHANGLAHVLGRRIDVRVQVDEAVSRAPRVGLGPDGGEVAAGVRNGLRCGQRRDRWRGHGRRAGREGDEQQQVERAHAASVRLRGRSITAHSAFAV
jgi:hypothetical protein